MKIASSQLRMSASHAERRQHEVRESLRAWIGPRRPDFEGRESRPATSSFRIDLYHQARTAQAAGQPEAAATPDAEGAIAHGPQGLLKILIEMLTGRPVRVFDPEALEGGPGAASPETPAPERAARSGGNAGRGVEYDRRETLDESEQTHFSASGMIRTSDGREIEFHLDFELNRTWHEESNLSLRAGDGQRKDPLVLNFNGPAAQLSSRRFAFDLDADGQTEALPLLEQGSGFLALDINGDGHINDGRELFGALTGDGFADLASHDEDGNGWIDENDAIFEQLRLWSPAADGAGTLTRLEEHGIGALALSRLATPFELRSASNESLGALRTSGLYLNEDGSAGTLQQIDLTV